MKINISVISIVWLVSFVFKLIFKKKLMSNIFFRLRRDFDNLFVFLCVVNIMFIINVFKLFFKFVNLKV